MNLLLWTLVVPLLTAALGGLGGPRPFKDATMAGGLALTFGLCLATANQFLKAESPPSVTPYELTGCPPWFSSCAHLSASCQASTASGICGATRRADS